MKKSERARRKRLLMRQMQHFVEAKVNDAVKLAYLTDEQVDLIDTLDLTALTEFKRNGKGAVEVKFVDRMKVAERMISMLEESESESEQTDAIVDLLGGGATL